MNRDENPQNNKVIDESKSIKEEVVDSFKDDNKKKSFVFKDILLRVSLFLTTILIIIVAVLLVFLNKLTSAKDDPSSVFLSSLLSTSQAVDDLSFISLEETSTSLLSIAISNEEPFYLSIKVNNTETSCIAYDEETTLYATNIDEINVSSSLKVEEYISSYLLSLFNETLYYSIYLKSNETYTYELNEEMNLLNIKNNNLSMYLNKYGLVTSLISESIQINAVYIERN